MQVYRSLPSAFLRRPSALAIGNFDGVHLGHQALLSEVVRAAHERGLQPAVVTFEPHPRDRLCTQTCPPRISTLYDKVERILACGIERVYMLPFSSHLASLSPQAFVRDILRTGLDAHWVSVGENFRFGADRSGNVETLKALGAEEHFEVFISPLLFHETSQVSSSRIRAALAAGDLVEASVMLGRRYSMTGRVIHGAALGRELGFPTLNMAAVPPGCRAKPAVTGVFAVRIHGLGHAVQNGVASLGCKPTVTSAGRWLLETHVFDWRGNAYGKVVRVEFVERLRGEKKFSGLDELKAAIAEDVRRARLLLGLAPEA